MTLSQGSIGRLIGIFEDMSTNFYVSKTEARSFNALFRKAFELSTRSARIRNSKATDPITFFFARALVMQRFDAHSKKLVSAAQESRLYK